MGNENRRSDFDEENWEMVSVIGVKTILRNKMTCSLLDQYESEERISDLPWTKKAEEIFEWRKNLPSEEHIPLLYYYQTNKSIIGSTQRHRVFTEHITRLSELPPISKQEAFLVLQQIVEVLPTLYKHFGLFHANVFTVGVSESGNTKVWVNENFAKNYAEEQDIIKNPSKNLELAIVNNLVRMLKAKVYNNDAAPEYPFSLNFLETLRFLKETRQRHPEYTVSKVYLNRSEFNQAYQGAVNQRMERIGSPSSQPVVVQIVKQEPVNRSDSQGLQGEQNRNRLPTAQKRHSEGVKTEQSETLQLQPQQQHLPSFSFHPHQQFPSFVKPNHQIIYSAPYPNSYTHIPPPPINQEAIMNNHQYRHLHNKTMPIIMDPKERQLQKSIYLTPPPSFIQQQPQGLPRQYPSPPKQHKNITPPKFLKRIAVDQHNRQPSPQNNINNGSKTSRDVVISNNRPISLSPMRRNTPAPTRDIPKDNTRPISTNKMISRRELSRIIEEDQPRHDSVYLPNPVKKMEQEGFNVELVESIYVKTNETDEGY